MRNFFEKLIYRLNENIHRTGQNMWYACKPELRETALNIYIRNEDRVNNLKLLS